MKMPLNFVELGKEEMMELEGGRRRRQPQHHPRRLHCPFPNRRPDCPFPNRRPHCRRR